MTAPFRHPLILDEAELHRAIRRERRRARRAYVFGVAYRVDWARVCFLAVAFGLSVGFWAVIAKALWSLPG
jgi:hypothetical protein